MFTSHDWEWLIYTCKFMVDFFKDGDFDGDSAHSFLARQGSATLSKPKITRRPLRWPPRPTKLPSWSHPGEGWRQSTTPGPWDPWENHGKIHVINGILGPKWCFFTGRISKTRKTWSFDWENHLFSKKKRMKSHVFFANLGPQVNWKVNIYIYIHTYIRICGGFQSHGGFP